jgi:hypothetical protein
VALVFVFSCGEQPTGIDTVADGDGLSGSGDVDPGAGGSFLLGTVSDTCVAPGHLEVWAMDVAFDTAAGIVSFDVQLRNHMRTDIYPPIHFVITEIRPRNIAVLEFDGTTGDGFPYYDFSDALGDDGVLEAGGITERVTVAFHTVTARSFAIGFRIDLGMYPPGGMIAGVVFRDDNKNGMRDRCKDETLCEPGIPGITVALRKPLSDGDVAILLVRTDKNGEYRFGGLRAGVYEVFVEVRHEEWEITSTNPLLVTLVEGADGEVHDFYGANFGLFPLQPSPYGTIGGVVFRDDNRNGIRERCKDDERCEPGIPGIRVMLEMEAEAGVRPVLFTRTNEKGEYRFGGLGIGIYKVGVDVNTEEWEVTSANPLIITLVEEPGGGVQDVLDAHFGLYPLWQPPQEELFGPVLVGNVGPFGTLLDSTFVDPPSPLPVVQNYYIEVMEPPFMWPSLGVVDSAFAWINRELVFSYVRAPEDSFAYFEPQTIRLPDGLVHGGENTIRLFTDGNEHAVLMWRVYKQL